MVLNAIRPRNQQVTVVSPSNHRYVMISVHTYVQQITTMILLLQLRRQRRRRQQQQPTTTTTTTRLRLRLPRPLPPLPLLLDDDVLLCPYVCLFVCSLSLKFVKSLATWQHLAVSGGLSYRVQYTSIYIYWHCLLLPCYFGLSTTTSVIAPVLCITAVLMPMFTEN